MNCNQCGAAYNNPNMRFCTECGAVLQSPKNYTQQQMASSPTYITPMQQTPPQTQGVQTFPLPSTIQNMENAQPSIEGVEGVPQKELATAHAPGILQQFSGLSNTLKMLIVGGCLILGAAVVFILFFSSPAIVGTWDEEGSGTWTTRIVFESNGTGIMFEFNENSMTQNEVGLRWSTSRDFDDILRLTFVYSDAPEDYDVLWFEFNIETNAMGNEILSARLLGVSEDDSWIYSRRIY